MQFDLTTTNCVLAFLIAHLYSTIYSQINVTRYTFSKSHLFAYWYYIDVPALNSSLSLSLSLSIWIKNKMLQQVCYLRTTLSILWKSLTQLRCLFFSFQNMSFPGLLDITNQDRIQEIHVVEMIISYCNENLIWQGCNIWVNRLVDWPITTYLVSDCGRIYCVTASYSNWLYMGLRST